MENEDNLLKEKELECSGEKESGGADRSGGADTEQEGQSGAARNVADSDHYEVESEDGGGLRSDGDEAASSIQKPMKGAKKISRKELLKLISKKNDMLQEMETEIKRQKEELKTKEDRFLRVAAEFENYKKRTRREWELLEQKAKAELITDILGVLDDFDRALEALGEREDHVADGVVLIVTGLRDILKRTGLREVEALGRRFDPQVHEAVGGVESEEFEEGFVAHVVQKGYELNDQLLRPAKVIVSKK